MSKLLRRESFYTECDFLLIEEQKLISYFYIKVFVETLKHNLF